MQVISWFLSFYARKINNLLLQQEVVEIKFTLFFLLRST